MWRKVNAEEGVDELMDTEDAMHLQRLRIGASTMDLETW